MKQSKWNVSDIPDQSGKIVVVTGANSGLGYETSKALAAKGAQVVMACRTLPKGQQAADQIRAELADSLAAEPQLDLMQLDLASLASIEAFSDAFHAQYQQLDLLINNAGVMAIPYATTADGFEMQFGTNHLGHFALTGRLLDLLLATPNARVVNVSSGTHRFGSMNFDDLNSESSYQTWRVYGQSKLANLLFTRELQRKLSGVGASVTAVAAHPGYAATNLQSSSGLFSFLNKIMAQSQEMGALPQLYAATTPDIGGGDYYGPDGFMEQRGYPKQVRAKDAAYDDASAVRLWLASEKMTGVTYDALEKRELVN